MKDKLCKIFSFLKENRQYNQQLQINHFSEILRGYDTTKDRAISLLWSVVYSQSQPRIGSLSLFWQGLYRQGFDGIDTFAGFIQILDSFTDIKCIKKMPKSPYGQYEHIFWKLVSMHGWGEKTAALFCKEAYLIHNTIVPSELIIWNDATIKNDTNDKLYLPVDKVIVEIFRKIYGQKFGFNKINNIISEHYKLIDEIIIWDELWFWGFITQYQADNDEPRLFGWNEEKYWGLRHAPKDAQQINEIKNKALDFVNILMECVSN